MPVGAGQREHKSLGFGTVAVATKRAEKIVGVEVRFAYYLLPCVTESEGFGFWLVVMVTIN